MKPSAETKAPEIPHARLKDMDAAGIDQVMIFPSTFVYLPLVENADAAYICARAYNDWAYDYCSADKKRLYPAAVLPVQNVDYAIEELRRVAKRGFQVGVGSADHRPGQVSDLSGIRSVVERIRRARHRARHAHVPVAGRGDVAGVG